MSESIFIGFNGGELVVVMPMERCGSGETESRGDSDGGGAANDHIGDGTNVVVYGIEFDVAFVFGECELVENREFFRIRIPFKGANIRLKHERVPLQKSGVRANRRFCRNAGKKKSPFETKSDF